ncbi:hypothetical protein ERJ75_000075000 [Trypanosoma vivax]|uniref:Uncharacterized protein n=1 Tax=Trypanosoma vivax (strain Y486) TaxID=1055687 RepID=F9WRU7_TRYVY|nr:hypothetical protein ERJ75_000075000 [Trypanosoma vivax]CCD20282.1 hypothetical protein, conserved in T. vivax [Trypanosoma vivax Y486]|eukprot:CCD20282.1 hypothetical protein, conserved in T. vivax [Trypanosoma vivax Y486]
MALFFRCVFLVALLGVAALGDKGTGSARTTRTNPRSGVLSRHREGGKYPRIQPRSVVTSETGSGSNTSSSVPGIQTTASEESTSLNNSTVSQQTELKKDCGCNDDCNCSEEENEKEECRLKCKEEKSKIPSSNVEENEVSQSSLQNPERQEQQEPQVVSAHVEQQEQQVTIQGEAQQGLESSSDITGNQSPSAGSPEAPKSKPAAEQVGGNSSENRPGKEKEHATPKKSDKQLGSTNNGESAKDNADKTESIGDTSEKEKAENNDETKGERDGQESTIGPNEGRSGENGSAETSSANLSGKTLTVLLLAILASFGV